MSLANVAYQTRRALIAVAFLAGSVSAQATGQALLTPQRIFSREFASDAAGPSRWLDDSTYTIVGTRKAGKAPIS